MSSVGSVLETDTDGRHHPLSRNKTTDGWRRVPTKTENMKRQKVRLKATLEILSRAGAAVRLFRSS